jgi:predicted nucleotidyltransferase component of viral defense system
MEDIQTLIAITSESLGLLNPSVIEKDFYVTKAIHAITRLDNSYFSLVFAGGTSLSKGYHLIKRMSEDIDFKIILKKSALKLSSAALRNKLRNLRSDIIQILQSHDFKIEDTAIKVMNAGQSIQIFLDYQSTYQTPYSLRSQILAEFTYDTIQYATKNLPISSLILETLGIDDGLSNRQISCVSVLETAAEKWVSITRRIAAINRGYITEDKSLIRHLYDLSKIEKAGLLDNTYYNLIKIVIHRDRKQFKNQYPEYFNDSIGEIDLSIKLLSEDPSWEKNYEHFLTDMVYEKNPPNYNEALSIIHRIREYVEDF